MVKILTMECAKKINFFPPTRGISPYYSPRMIMHQQSLDYEKHYSISFSTYIQAHTEPDPKNTQLPITAIPITENIIDLFHALATNDNMKEGLKKESRAGTILYDSSWIAGVDYNITTERKRRRR
jgi:hypothetical protein